MEIDPNKTYVYLVDNEDGTCTYTFNVPEIGLCASLVLEMSIMDFMALLVDEADSNMTVADSLHDIEKHTIMIPNAPEEL